jgi:peptide/nickel transport system substrate-binding protein
MKAGTSGLIGLITILALIVSGPTAAMAATTLVHGSASEPRALDPYFHSETPTNSMNKNLYDALLHFDSELQVHPGLALTWDNPDSLTWIFHLRKDVTFHDGAPFTAADVKFSIERAKNWAKSGFKSTVNKVQSVEVVDDYTVKITTPKPFGILHRKLAQIGIMNKAYVEKHGDEYQTDHPNGTGPYKLVEWVKGDHITLTANENHFNGAPAIKQIIVRPLTNDATRTAALLSGEINIADDIPVLDVARIKSNKKVKLTSRPGLRLIYLQMDHDRDVSPKAKGPDGKNPLRNKKVRQAIYLAINEDAIVKHVMNGFAFPASQFYPKEVFGYDDTITRPAFNPDKAKALLAEAGYPDGFDLTIDSPNDRYVNDDKIAQSVAASLSRIGINMKVNALPKKTFFPMTDRREASFFLIGWSCADGDGSAFLDGIAHTYDKDRGFGRYNRGRYSNPEVDRLIEAAGGTVDQDQRLKHMQAAQRIALIEDQAFIPLHYQVDLYGNSKNVKWTPRADHYFYYRDMAID